MLDVRITGYVVPLAEQPQASLTPVISVRNYADEDAVITGLIRIYRDSTGLMIYDSRLAVTQLEHGTSTNIAALTPFDPPSPADDDYFIKADLVATSYKPGPPLSVTLGAWHFDIKTPPMGEAPAGHHVTHEDGGSDEVDATGLEGTGGAPGGADSHIQYNNGGAFGGEANLVWDDTNKRVGIGIAAPTATLHIDAPAATIPLIVDSAPTASVDIAHFLSSDNTQLVKLIRAGGTTVFMESGGSVGLFGTFSYHAFRIRTNYLDRLTIDVNGLVGIATTSPTAYLDVNSDIIRLRTPKTPATAGAAGNQGDICWDADFIYVCVATNSWKRVVIAAW